EEWAVAEGNKKREPDYIYVGNDGKKLAKVRGKGDPKGFLAAAGSWTGKGGWLKLTFLKDLTPPEKLIVLGMTITIESIITTLKESKRGQMRLWGQAAAAMQRTRRAELRKEPG